MQPQTVCSGTVTLKIRRFAKDPDDNGARKLLVNIEEKAIQIFW